MNRGYKRVYIYIVGWEGMWKVIFCQIGCSSGLTSRLGWVTSSNREQTAWPAWDFCPVVNSWHDASASGMLGMCASIWRLDLATELSCEFKLRANDLTGLGLLSCSEQLERRFNFWHAWCASIWRLVAASHPRDPVVSPCFFAQTWAILHTLSHTTLTRFPPKYKVTNC